MATPLNILIVEDSADDTELILVELRRAGFEPEWRRVETEADFLAEIKKSADVILSDYSMPQFSGLQAVKLLRAVNSEIPFILISGTVGEDSAVEAMRMGATDYLLKDRLGRLGQAVTHALLAAHERREHKKAEQQILIQTRALEAAANAIIITDREGRVLLANPAFSMLTGYSLAEVQGKNPRLLKSGEHPPEFYRELWQAITAGRSWHGELLNRRKDGTLYCEEMTVTPVRATGGEITHFIAVKQDTTDRKHTADELRWRTAFFEAQVNSALDGILVVDSRKKILLQNRRMIQLFQVPPVIVTRADDDALLRHVTAQMKNPREFLEGVTQLYEHPDKVGRDEIEMANGTVLDRYSAPVCDPAGKYYGRIWTFRDITEQRKLEAQFRQAQKMEVVGQLAGGVAHDFNNILAVIQMQAGLLRAGKKPAKDFATEIEMAAERAANITRQLLLFSRRQAIQPRDLDLNSVISAFTKLLQLVVGEGIHLHFQFAPQPLLVHADVGMLEQVLMNLAVNSRDAMPDGGRLAIEVSAVRLDEAASRSISEGRAGSFACLSVEDTGTGIAPEILPRIFEPFFTTKDVGKGTGLGLATIFGIVQQHSGWINVDSQMGCGTTFRIFLPRLEKNSGNWPAPSAPSQMRGGTETILLVEDDAFLRASVCHALIQLGYHVIEAASGAEALQAWNEHRHKIQLLLADLVMPGGITGKDLAAKFCQQKPALKIIYTSGYSGELVDGDFSLEEDVNFLTKPFQISRLADIVRKKLDEPSGPDFRGP